MGPCIRSVGWPSGCRHIPTQHTCWYDPPLTHLQLQLPSISKGAVQLQLACLGPSIDAHRLLPLPNRPCCCPSRSPDETGLPMGRSMPEPSVGLMPPASADEDGRRCHHQRQGQQQPRGSPPEAGHGDPSRRAQLPSTQVTAPPAVLSPAAVNGGVVLLFGGGECKDDVSDDLTAAW